MKKQFFAAAMILALGAGFTACSSDDLNVKEQKEVGGKEATTYLTYTFSVPASGTRASNSDATSADPGAAAEATDDAQGGTTPGHNYVSVYQGNDAIKNVTAYVFAGDNGAAKLEATQSLDATGFDYVNDEGGKTVIKPKKGIHVTVGKKKVFLVVNPSTDATNMLKNLKTLAEFEAAYNSDALTFTGRTATKANPSTDAAEVAAHPLVMDLAAGTAVKTAADVVATVGTGTEKSYIMMTGAPVVREVSANVDEHTTVNEPVSSQNNNRFSFTVKRAVATVTISTKQESYNIIGDDPTEDGLQNVTVATLSQLTFSEAQGEQKLYFSQQAAPTADAGSTYKTPAYSFVPTTDDEYANAKAKYEYNGLWRVNTTNAKNTKGFAVPVHADGVLTSTDAQTFVAQNVHVPFLPATHKWAKDGGTYKEGNTAYVLVRAYITPKFVYQLNAQGELEVNKNYTGDDVFYGDDGKFYATDAAAQKAIKKAKGDENAKQYVKFYKGRICMYTVWINPDKTDKTWKNAPATRNNIYHVSINSITTLGESYNPLVPGDFPNPDPKPTPKESPNEGPNPHKPNQNISPDQTWMSVDTEVVRWSIHSYGVDL